MENTFYVAGIDCGGTKTECVIVDQDGRCIGIGWGGSSNINYTSIPDVLESIRTAIESAIKQSGPVKVVLTACTHRAASVPEVADLVSNLLGGKVRQYSEGEAALGCAGIFERFGIAHIAGTGSSTFGFSKDGKSILIGGWGMLLGDEGGAYDIAVKGLRAAVRALDGRAPLTILLNLACKHFGITAEREPFIQLAARASRVEIASFAPKVTAAAHDGDFTAQIIVNEAIGEHILSIAKMAYKLFSTRESFPIVLHGGVMSDDMIAEEVTRLVKKGYPNADIRRPVHSPGVGIALFALNNML